MRLLLDESVPRKLRFSLAHHEVRTAVEMGWNGVANGELLALASKDFDALITADKNLQYQQNLSALPIAVVVLDAHSNTLAALLPLVPSLESVLANLAPRSLIRVSVNDK